VLVVEDTDEIRELVTTVLRRAGLDVREAVSGAAALDEVRRDAPDLIVLDLGLPDGDGMELIRDVRGWSPVPIIVLSARIDEGDKIAALDAGADDYLTKPFEFRELLARLRALLRRSGDLRPDRIAVEDLELDTAAQTAARGGRQIRLTTKEYALLEYLARNSGRVVGREEISEHVWDETFDPFTNTIEVYVNRLRRKIDERAPRPLIHTRRGAGYMLGGAKSSSAAKRATPQNAMLEGASNRTKRGSRTQ
jgi:two-component system copper resistance phosphate regulon response regulator CusR